MFIARFDRYLVAMIKGSRRGVFPWAECSGFFAGFGGKGWRWRGGEVLEEWQVVGDIFHFFYDNECVVFLLFTWIIMLSVFLVTKYAGVCIAMTDVHGSLELCIRKPFQTVASNINQEKGVRSKARQRDMK
jgi:hypothetical protein